MSLTIDLIDAREILDSRGNPTVEVDVDPRRRRASAAPRCRRAPPPARTRRSSCATATRRATAARACSRRSATSTTRSRPALYGLDAADQAGVDARPDRARRHAQQGPARRQRHPRRLAGRAPTRPRPRSACRSTATSAAPGRGRCPCRCSTSSTAASTPRTRRDFQEFMVMPVGAPTFARGPAHRRRGLPRAASAMLARRRVTPPVGRRGRVRARRSPSNEAAVEVILRAIEQAGYRPGEDVAIALDPAATELSSRAPASTAPRRATCWPRRAARSSRGELVDLWADWVDAVPDRLDRGRPGRGRLGRLEGADAAARRARPARRRRPVRDQHRAGSRRGIEEDAANAILIKLNQIGTLTETLDAIEMAQRAGWTRGRLAPLRRDRGHHHRRPRRRHGRRPDQDRRPVALRARGQVQPAAADRGRARRRGALPGPAALATARESLRRPRRDHGRLRRDRDGGHDRG